MRALVDKSQGSGRVAVVVCVLLIAALAGAFMGFRGAVWNYHIIPGVHVAGIPVGGLTQEEAATLLEERLARRLTGEVVVNWGYGRMNINLKQAGVRIDAKAMVEAAYSVGRTGSLVQQLKDRFTAARHGWDVPVSFTTEPAFDEIIDKIAAAAYQPAVNAAIILKRDDSIEIHPEQYGKYIDKEELKERIFSVALKQERHVFITAREVRPQMTAEDIASWGIKTVVARYKTSFNPADENRTHNLKLAAQALDGTLIKPGEMFSFNKKVGPRMAASGYKEAPVVREGQLVPDVGGGVCQVSTTLYNAVILAGLNAATRSAHSIPATYVDLGLDAAVAYDYIDFRFANTTAGNLYIKAQVVDDIVDVALLGPEKAPPYTISTVLENVLPIPVVEVPDINLEPGQKVTEQEGAVGYVVSVWRKLKQGSEEKVELVNRTTYKARPKMVRTGIGEQPRIPVLLGRRPETPAAPPPETEIQKTPPENGHGKEGQDADPEPRQSPVVNETAAGAAGGTNSGPNGGTETPGTETLVVINPSPEAIPNQAAALTEDHSDQEGEPPDGGAPSGIY
ncbi:MAG TPA: hypothetical protein GXX29_12850 [Firmicutes bacterium]|nr:hypothetical protein [Bacillota bacterium]